MIGGGLARKAAKQPIIHVKRLRAKVKSLGGAKAPLAPSPPVLPPLAYCTSLVQLQLEYCTAKLYSHRVSVSNSMKIQISLSQAAMAFAYCSLGT